MLGITDHIFRNVFNKHFSGFDYAIAPYIISNKKNEYKESLLKRVILENNNLKTIPQILSNNAEQFIKLGEIFSDMGHSEINWNIACPYPRAIKNKLGSALLEYPEVIDEVLNKFFERNLNPKISIKLRLGLKDNNDIFKVLPVLNKYPIETVTIHPRTASQMYKESVSLDTLEIVSKELKHDIVYSGDIKTVSDYENIKNIFPNINKIMIGRGILINPFLIEEVNGIFHTEKEKTILLKKYHRELLSSYSSFFSGDSHLLTRMKEIWSYQADYFDNSAKIKKNIKKCKTIDCFESIVNNVIV